MIHLKLYEDYTEEYPTEESLIREIDFFTHSLNENTEWALRLLNKVYTFFQTSKTISEKALKTMTTFINKLLNKLTPEKRSKFDKYFKKFEDRMVDTIQSNLNKTEISDSVRIALNTAREKNLITKEDIKGSFETNKNEIMGLIKTEISKNLDNTKKEVISELDEIDKTLNSNVVNKALRNLKTFTVGTSFMMVFGLIDNLGLLAGMEAIEGWVMNMGFDSQVAAGIGNTFSDAIGVVIGGAVAAGLYKLLKVKGEGTFPQQLTGVVVGCMIPIIIKMLIMII